MLASFCMVISYTITMVCLPKVWTGSPHGREMFWSSLAAIISGLCPPIILLGLIARYREERIVPNQALERTRLRRAAQG